MKPLYRKQDDDEERSSVADRSAKKNNNKKTTKVVSFPVEIVEDILSRLPAKSILRSGSVSKPWLSLISGSPFTKLHFTRATTTHRRNGFFISAYEYSTKKRYYFTAAGDGGTLTLLMTVDEDIGTDITGPSQLNGGGGLVWFTSRTWKSNNKGINTHAFVVNPATRKVFRLPDMNSPEYAICGYMCCFDESRNDIKILLMRMVFKTEKYEFMLFSLSGFSWRVIDVEPPVVGFNWRRLGGGLNGGICVNGIGHIMLQDMSFEILAFNFGTEKFSVISLPQGVLPPRLVRNNRAVSLDFDIPRIAKIDGCLAVVVHKVKRSQVHMWLLKDWENRVWVKEIVKLPKSWKMTIKGFPLSIDANMDDQIVFNLSKVTENRVTIPVYNIKTKLFKTLEFNLDHQFASVKFHHIKCYVETILPLSDNWSVKSHGQIE